MFKIIHLDLFFTIISGDIFEDKNVKIKFDINLLNFIKFTDFENIRNTNYYFRNIINY